VVISVVTSAIMTIIVLTGWMELDAGTPRIEDSREVVDVQLAQLHLSGASQLGLVTVSEREDAVHVSQGEIRSLQSGAQFPASSYLNLFANISAPDTPFGALSLHNDDALQLVPWENGGEASLTRWPPFGVQYRKADQGAACVPLSDDSGTPPGLSLCISGLSLDIAPGLPSFSVVTPTAAQSQHNSHSWTAGDNWIGQVVGAIEHGPDWASTAIFITWDDCGCFYDHVNPLRFDPGWGVRVPMVIVSPYARAGYTDSTPTSFAGILAYAERTFGLAALNSSDKTAYAFTNSFDYSQTPLQAPVPMTQTPLPLASVKWLRRHPDAGTDPT